MNVDYDRVAPTFPARYEQHDYAEVDAALRSVASNRNSVLEVGCGTGHWLARLRSPQRRLVGVDPSREMLRAAASSGHEGYLTRGSAEALPFPDDVFDLVYAINALHHFPSAVTFFAEAARVLGPGGVLATVGLDPSTGTDQWYVYDYFPRTLVLDRRRYPGAAAIAEGMEAAGFESISTSLAQHLPGSEPARAYLESGRLHRDTTSQLSLLPDAEYEAGIERIRADILAGENAGRPALLTADLRLYLTEGRLPS